MNFGNLILLIILICIAVGALWGLFYYLNTKSSSIEHIYKYSTRGRKISEKVLKNYYKEGLNDNDIRYFRETMATALKQINQIESLTDKNKTLSKLNQKLNLNKLLHGFFKEIVAKPSKIEEAGEFLYKELPALNTIYVKYSQIDSHLYKDQETDKVLQISIEAINNAYKKINEQYHKFIADDLDTLHEAANNF
ncbi:5-bromo-4-chloroindolyl phosphate hydrolysis family protein [Xylocopilactobacillus apicola]|uniref:5-bromo-4-chloroindolyl phosphate hydrolysis protein n=1 Tax=Xylocopilactobacillus apicola TaxID=2932184 RepID=A0AAU9D7E3_9LACO|nr:5-bromo-4-chloroindolyl phosphate hydrolysis family protein [Xylocopilactobacillus apicola]BDR58235.1 hypothetical protein XA3_06760 [Xylocopilactobacillus apicola]